ncbi:MAG: hypothetical protein LC808_27385 [Actinobacteria bacterium]|nr:hypothetical protein [Actinomycetota bacterium]
MTDTSWNDLLVVRRRFGFAAYTAGRRFDQAVQRRDAAQLNSATHD